MESTLTILNDEGLHARPAGQLVKTANQFSSEITLEANGQCVNAKSIIHIMSLGLKANSQITLKANGPDAMLALKRLGELVQNRFELS